MVDLSGFSTGNFIKADEVKEVTKRGQPFIIAIASEAVLVKKTYDDGKTSERAECEVVMKDGTERAISLNKTSVGDIVKEYGADSKAWVGKKISLMTVSKKIDGKEVNIIYANPIVDLEEALEKAVK